MSWEDEKMDEKMNEKEIEKHEEKSAEEKSYEEKYRRDPLGTIIWAVILIWVGVVMLANNFGLLDFIRFQTRALPFDFPFFAETWSFIFLGAGVILLIEVVIRLTVPDYRRPVMGTFILAVVFFGVGLGSWETIWPVILIIVGASIVLRAVLGKQE